jgi:cytochrome c oxidase cbb3-type subunit 1
VQGLMWRAFNDDGTLTYSFIESVKATYPFYLVRLAGGLLFLAGMLLMAWNVWMTVRHEKPRPVPVPAPAPEPAAPLITAPAPLLAGAAVSGAQS